MTSPPVSPLDLDLALVLVSEGGKVDDRRDPGGRTNRGVTQRVYDAWRVGQGLPRRDVYRIAAAEVRAIYVAQYAAPLHIAEMSAGVGYALLDAGVNSGVTAAVKWLQRALGIAADGHLGLVTLAAVRAAPDRGALIDRICDLRLGLLRHLPTWAHFGAGWSRRVASVRQRAHRMERPPATTVIRTAAVPPVRL